MFDYTLQPILCLLYSLTTIPSKLSLTLYLELPSENPYSMSPLYLQILFLFPCHKLET